MYEITNRLQQPYSAVCYVHCEWEWVDERGLQHAATRASGVVVGYNDVLTALHTVFDATKGGWARSVTVTPAADTSPYFTSPLGTYSNVGRVQGVAANWDVDNDGLLTAVESSGDLALLGLRSRIGDTTGWLPLARHPGDLNALMVGYPQSGSGMMAEAVFADALSDTSAYKVGSLLGAGASGGPLLYTTGNITFVVGVLSSGNERESTYAGLFNPSAWSWVQAEMAANDTLLGYPPATVQDGGSLYTGTVGNDSFAGSAGTDTFNGRSGDDRFDGGGGIDTALYAGPRNSYALDISATGFAVRDTQPGRDGNDSLLGVERLMFLDLNVAFDTAGPAGQAYRLYQAAFDRVADVAGLGFHMSNLDHGMDIGGVASHFVASPEFASRYGALDNEGFVRQLYSNVLHREPEAAGVAYHLQNLNTTHQRSDVLAGFSESPENQVNVIGLIQGGMVYMS